MKALAVLLLSAFVSVAGDHSWLYSEGQAFYRILSSEPTRIVWFESMPNPDDPQEIWSSLVWSGGSKLPPPSVVSIAFALTGAWSTENFWQLDLTRIGFPPNFTPTNAIQAFILRTFEHVTDPHSQIAALVSDLPTHYVRGQVMVTAEDGVGDPEILALVDSYGHSIIERLHGLPATFLVAVPLNEEMAWAATYETNSIIRYAEVNGIIRAAASRIVLPSRSSEGTE
jgi:hypothetical protein